MKRYAVIEYKGIQKSCSLYQKVNDNWIRLNSTDCSWLCEINDFQMRWLIDVNEQPILCYSTIFRYIKSRRG